MRKIMYISHAATLGGAEQSLIDIVKYIKEKIHPIVILPKSGAMEDVLNTLGVTYYIVDFPQTKNSVGKKDLIKNAKDYCDSFEAAQELAELIEAEKIELVHSNSTVIDVGAMAAVFAGKPHVWHCREFMEEDFSIEYQNKEWKQYLFQQTTMAITISDCIYQKYEKTYQMESEKLYDGIDADRFYVPIENRHPDINSFYVAGSVSENKGQMDAVKAVGILVKEGYKDIKLYIVGSASKQDKWSLKKYINANGLENNIQFIEFSYSLDDLRKQCIASITTSKMEALGRVTVEAMLAGDFVIGANTAGTAEILGLSNQYGFLYEQGDATDLADKMKKVISMPQEELKTIIRQAQYYAKEKFNAPMYADNLAVLYEKVIQKYSYQKETCDVLANNQEVIDQIRFYYEQSKIIALEEIKKETSPDFSFIKFILEKMQSKQYLENLKKRKISRIAIYGVGQIGMLLLDNLEIAGFKIDYVIDQNEGFLSYNYHYMKPFGVLPETDAIIITIKESSKISECYKKLYPYQIILVEDLV